MMKITAIEKFLENWREAAESYYMNLGAEYADLREEARATQNFEAIKEWNKKVGEKVAEMVRLNDFTNPENLVKILDREVEAKRKNLVSKIEKAVGIVTDADHLVLGKDGNINGKVTGEKGSVWVETIGAGGYNIQKYHYRVLVKKAK